MREQTFETWFDQNFDVIDSLWCEHLSNMQDSLEHRMYVSNSDDCFKEFAEELFEEGLPE